MKWGRKWYEIAELIARMADRPSLPDVRRIIKDNKAAIDKMAGRADLGPRETLAIKFLGTSDTQGRSKAPMITTKNLSKRYGDKLAVDDLTFRCAGRSAGVSGRQRRRQIHHHAHDRRLHRALCGQVSVCGHDIENAPVAAKSCMGYLPEGAPSYGEMTVAEFLDFVADIRGLRGERRRKGATSSSSGCAWRRSSTR
jgi:hypothetical protein